MICNDNFIDRSLPRGFAVFRCLTVAMRSTVDLTSMTVVPGITMTGREATTDGKNSLLVCTNFANMKTNNGKHGTVMWSYEHDLPPLA